MIWCSSVCNSSSVGEGTRIVVALDYHANLDENTIRHADGVFGFHLSPHTDQGETGERAANCMVRALRGEIHPVCSIHRPNLMVPSIFSATGLEPMASVVQDSIGRASHDKPYLDVTVFAGFSYADVPNCGFSVVAVTDNDRALADRTTAEICRTIAASPEAFSHRDLVYGLDDGIEKAIGIAAKKRLAQWFCSNTPTEWSIPPMCCAPWWSAS